MTGPLQTPSTPRRTDPYLPPGVPDQVFPPDTAAFPMLAGGRCGPLLREINAEWPAPGSADADPTVPSFPDSLTYLYRAAAKACLSQWVGAEADFRLIDRGKLCAHFDDGGGWNSSFQSETECRQVRMRVYEWTAALLKAHRADPTFVPNFPTPPTP